MVNIKKIITKSFFQVGGFIVLFSVVSLALDIWRGKNIPKNSIPMASYVPLSSEPFNSQPSNHEPSNQKSLNEKPLNIVELSNNRLIIMYFWAEWCGPCKVTTPSVKQLAKHYPVVSVAMASGENKKLARYVNHAKMTFPVINDNNQTIARSWGVKVTPSILFIKNGKVLGFTAGVSGYPGLLARAWWLDTSL